VNNNLTTDKLMHAALSPACSGSDLDVQYQTCTAPCCGCWSAYWPALIDLWRRCGAPASYCEGNAIVGLKAKQDWLCGTETWGACVKPKWDALLLPQCTSEPDRTKLREAFGLYRDRRSEAESCSCIQQATPALVRIMQECSVPNWQWFEDYGQRRLQDNKCAVVEVIDAAPTSVDAAAVTQVIPWVTLAAFVGVAGGSAATVMVLAVARRRRASAECAGGLAPLLGAEEGAPEPRQ